MELAEEGAGYGGLKFNSDLFGDKYWDDFDGVDLDEVHGKSQLPAPKIKTESVLHHDSELESFSSVNDVWDTINASYGTKIEFSAVSAAEGHQRLRAYLPLNKKKQVVGNSGITIATGFDIGQYDGTQIKNFKFPKALENKLLPFVAAKREDAKKLLPLAYKTLLLPQELNLVDYKLKKLHLDATIKS